MLITFIGVYTFTFQVKYTDRKAKIYALKVKFNLVNLTRCVLGVTVLI